MPISRTAVRSSRSTGTTRRFGSSFGSIIMADAPPSTKETPDQKRENDYAAWLARQEYSITRSREDEVITRLKGGDVEYTIAETEALVTKYKAAGDQASVSYWSSIHDAAVTKAEDNYIAGAIASGEADYTDLLALLLERRDTAKQGDAAFVALNKQIADVRNAIAAQDFNDKVQKAYTAFVDTGDKQKYMTALLGVYGTVKDDTARGKLLTQIQGLKTEIDKERQLRDFNEVNVALIDYYTSGGASKVLALIGKKVNDAQPGDDTSKYVTLAAQIVSREQTLANQAKSAAAAGNTEALTELMTNRRADLAVAKDRLEALARDDTVPTATDWAIYWAAGDRVLAGIDIAVGSGRLTAKEAGTLSTEQRAVIEGRSIQKAAAGADVLKQIDDRAAVLDRLVRDAGQRKDGIAGLTSAIESGLADLKRLAASPFLAQTERAQTALEKLDGALGPVRDAYQKAKAEMDDPTLRLSFKAAQSQWESYVEKYQKSIGDGAYRTFDEWRQIMSAQGDAAAKAAMLGIATKDGTNNGFTQVDVDKALKVRDDAATERDTLTKTMSASARLLPDNDQTYSQGGLGIETIAQADVGRATRNAAAWAPGGYLDESSRAARLAAATKPQGPVAGGHPAGGLAALRTDDLAGLLGIGVDQGIPASDNSMAGPGVFQGQGAQQALATVHGEGGGRDPFAAEQAAPVQSFGQQPAMTDPGVFQGQGAQQALAAVHDQGGARDPFAAEQPAGEQYPDAQMGGDSGGLMGSEPDWAAAFRFLQEPTTLDLPAFDLPDLPLESPFLTDGLGGGYSFSDIPYLNLGGGGSSGEAISGPNLSAY